MVIEAATNVRGPAARRPEHAGRVRYPRQVAREIQRRGLQQSGERCLHGPATTAAPQSGPKPYCFAVSVTTPAATFCFARSIFSAIFLFSASSVSDFCQY
jgi:hypothetical protein